MQLVRPEKKEGAIVAYHWISHLMTSDNRPPSVDTRKSRVHPVIHSPFNIIGFLCHGNLKH